jgi:redox-sensitive bicupin YhaK (pirin superfamily)
MPDQPILQVQPLGFPWPATDPFLFCAYHDDAYPAANDQMGPATGVAGRDIGQDFSRRDGWSMYHGNTVPGFPAHPHRGFETVTIVRQGLVDHSDSLGATARFGRGDVQWLTAGRGVVHAEMFPLLRSDRSNPLELFQIWLNLPARSKMAPPHFTMLWAHDVPRVLVRDARDRATEITVVAGPFLPPGASTPLQPPPPPPESWAARAEHDVAIWTVAMDPGAHWTMPPAPSVHSRRMLYLFRGTGAHIGGRSVPARSAVQVRAEAALEVVASDDAGLEFLLLQGRPIEEPVAQYGPFVMNRESEIAEAMQDYRRTQFGGWPFDHAAPVHPRNARRFAKHPDGRVEEPAA